MRDLGYKRFIFTEAQQITLRDLLIQQHRIVLSGTGPLDQVLARKYKGLITSIRRQSSKQAEYHSKQVKEGLPPHQDEVGYAASEC